MQESSHKWTHRKASMHSLSMKHSHCWLGEKRIERQRGNFSIINLAFNSPFSSLYSMMHKHINVSKPATTSKRKVFKLTHHQHKPSSRNILHIHVCVWECILLLTSDKDFVFQHIEREMQRQIASILCENLSRSKIQERGGKSKKSIYNVSLWKLKIN